MSKRHLESWHKDKAIQDNIVESWLCVDCGVNTHPGCVSGPDLRLAFAMGAKKETVTFEDNNDDCGHRGTIAQKDLALRLIDRGSTQMAHLGEPEAARHTQAMRSARTPLDGNIEGAFSILAGLFGSGIDEITC